MVHFLDNTIRYMYFLVITVSASLVTLPLLTGFFQGRIVFNRYRPASVSSRNLKFFRVQQLRRLLLVTVGSNSDIAVLLFLFLSFSLGISTLLFLILSGQAFLLILFFPIVAGSLPYLYLRLQHFFSIVRGSHEGDRLVTELANQYKINHFNMVEAIDKTIVALEDEPFSRRHLFRLSLELKQSRGIDDIDQSVQNFAFALDTQWGVLLANCIYMAIGFKENVTTALDDIVAEMKDLKALSENHKQENIQALTIIQFGAPLLYFVSLYIFFNYRDFTFKKYVEYQFQNPQAFTIFVCMAIMQTVNIATYFLLKYKKNDF